MPSFRQGASVRTQLDVDQLYRQFAILLLTCCIACRGDNVLFYSIRPSAGPATPLTGASVDEGLPIQAGDEELLGQIDGVESGEVTGWACQRGYMTRPLQVCSGACLLSVLQWLRRMDLHASHMACCPSDACATLDGRHTMETQGSGRSLPVVSIAEENMQGR